MWDTRKPVACMVRCVASLLCPACAGGTLSVLVSVCVRASARMRASLSLSLFVLCARIPVSVCVQSVCTEISSLPADTLHCLLACLPA